MFLLLFKNSLQPHFKKKKANFRESCKLLKNSKQTPCSVGENMYQTQLGVLVLETLITGVHAVGGHRLSLGRYGSGFGDSLPYARSD